MDYSQNIPRSDLSAQIERWLTMPVKDEGHGKWLLFDGAMIEEKRTKRLVRASRPDTIYNIFAHNQYSAYGFHAPHLVRLDSTERSRTILDALLRHTAGCPAIAFLDATGDIEVVRSYLSWLAQAQTSDGLRVYCRFADTRITPALVRALSDVQIAILGRCIRTWHILNRVGEFEDVIPAGQDARISTTSIGICSDAIEDFILSDEQYLSLMSSAESDEIFQMLCEGSPELVPERNRGTFHERLFGLVVAGRKCGLETTGDIYQFCVIALTTRDDFYLRPELDDSWEKTISRVASFPSVVAGWPDQIWSLLAQPAHLALPK